MATFQIFKPERDLSNATNCRPIALTSVLSKVMERLVNRRLLDYLETRAEFATAQTRGLRGSCAIDQLVRLETVVRTAFAKEEHISPYFLI